MRKGSVLFLVPFPPNQAPSQRFRLEIYEPYLQKAGIDYHIASFLDSSTTRRLYKKGSAFIKAWGTIKGYLRRIKCVLFDIHKYEFVFIIRQAAPLGPPVFEWIIARLWRKKMIYDFDDALWVPRTSRENMIIDWLKCSWKVRFIVKWSYKVSAGNEYLAEFARAFNNNVFIIPTCVDMERQHNMIKTHHAGKPVVGWTGSHSTIEFMEPAVPFLKKLQEVCDFTFLVICNKKPDLDLRDWTYKEWDERTEIEDLLGMDIGIMPLAATPWTMGKCGFKIIQYMSLGIPAVASPTGVNSHIIDHGINGYLCRTGEDWIQNLRLLIEDPELRKKMGMLGREKIEAHYSIRSKSRDFIGLFS